MLRIPLAAVALALACVACPAVAQSTLSARVVDAHERTPLPGVNVLVEATTIGGTTDADGFVNEGPIPDGVFVFSFSFVGFRPERLRLTFPLEDSLVVVALEEAELELDKTTVTATRTSRTIADTPTRVETIAGEELEEKIAMDPSGISMLLKTKDVVAQLVDETGALIKSEKMLEIHLTPDGRAVRASDQFGIGRASERH